MKKWWAKFLAALALLLVVLCSMLFSSSAHHQSDLEKYKAQLRAAGEKLDVTELAPPIPAPEKNGADLFLAAARYIEPYYGALQSNQPPMMRMVAPGKAMIGWQQGAVIDAQARPAVTNSWNDMDQALQAQAPAFDLLRKAAERQQLNFVSDYSQFPNNLPLLSPLTKMKGAAIVLSGLAVCDLHRGDTASAVTNLDSSMKLVNEWQTEPILISQLVRIALAAINSAAQWELLQATNLTDPQLNLLQHDWEAADFVRPMANALAMERDGGCAFIERLRGSNSPSASLSTMGSGPATGPLGIFRPMAEWARRGTVDTLWRISWSYKDELTLLRGEQAAIDALREADTNGFFKDAIERLDRKFAKIGTNRIDDDWMRRFLDKNLGALFRDSATSLGGSVRRTMAIEATRSIVITAIALKRYQLRHNSLPPDLNALVPEILSAVPRDPVDGKLLRYKPNSDGTYLLYSLGSDGKDDGGAVGPNRNSNFYWQRGPDWVWPQPATAAEIQKYYDNLPK